MKAGWLLAAGAILLTPLAALQADQAEDDPANWPRYARDEWGTRYSPLDRIDRENVGDLEQAWSFQLRPEGGAALLGGMVPIVIDGRMYMPLGNAVVALDGASGRELWRHQPASGLVRRSVSWWPGDAQTGPRLFYSFGSGIRALDPATGDVDTGFGNGGEISFEGPPSSYPPSIYGDVMIVGASVGEDPRGASGNSRAFSARTGEKLWEFNTVPQPGEVGHETWLGDGWKDRSGTNMWIWYTTADPEAGLVYMTIGSPSPNYYGGDRPGDNLFGNSLVAVDIETGAYRWHFQAIHHDIWDWDMPAPPVLTDIEKDGRTVPALALTGKAGLMYILDRETGEPIHGVNEVLVAPGDVPGEWYSPTQPMPMAPRPLARMWWDPRDVVTAEDTSPEHAAACRALLNSYGGSFFNAGPFTPFMLHEEGEPPRATINLPHNGGSNWGGSAADPARGIIYVNITEEGSIGWTEKRDPERQYGRAVGNSNQPYDRGSLSGGGGYETFSASVTIDGEQVSMPCIRPPWGHLNAVDAGTGEVLWSTRLGVTPQLPEGRRETGASNWTGGPIVTAGGLVFVGATADALFRAFDAGTGELLWSAQLPYSPQTIPMTYAASDGRQYVAIVAANARAGGPPARNEQGQPLNGESLYVFALPR